MRSQKMVLISFMVTLGSGALAFYLPTPYRKKTLWGATRADGDLPPMRFFLGTGIAFFGISAVSEFRPELAGPFAALVMTTAGLFNGVPALEYLMNSGGQSVNQGPAMNQTPSNSGIRQTNVKVPVVTARGPRRTAPVKIRMFAHPNRPNNLGLSE